MERNIFILTVILSVISIFSPGGLAQESVYFYEDGEMSEMGHYIAMPSWIIVGTQPTHSATERGSLTGAGPVYFTGPGRLNFRGNGTAFAGSFFLQEGTFNLSENENFFGLGAKFILNGSDLLNPDLFPTLQIEAGKTIYVDGSSGTTTEERLLVDGAGRIQVLDGAALIFSGNSVKPGLAAAEARSFLFSSSSVFLVDTVGKNSLLDMRDPMSGVGGSITKTGAGTWKLGDLNRFVEDGTRFSVHEGMLYLYGEEETGNTNFEDPFAVVQAGRISLLGNNAAFTLVSGATLGVGQETRIETPSGTIDIQGGSTLAFNLERSVSNFIPHLDLYGDVRFTGSGQVGIDLLSLPAAVSAGDSYVLVQKNSGPGFDTVIDTMVTMQGKALNSSRLEFTLTRNLNDLVLTFDGSFGNQRIYWNGDGGIWNLTNENWNDGSNPIKFFDGDIVVFDGTVGGVIEIEGGSTVVGDLLVYGAADYTINGSIIADPVLSSLSAGGLLEKTGAGTLTLNGANKFDNVYLNGGTVVAGHDRALGSSSVFIDGSTTLRIERNLAVDSGFHLSGANTVLTFDIGSGRTLTLEGTNRPEIAAVEFEAMHGNMANIRFASGGNLVVQNYHAVKHGGGFHLRNDDLVADHVVDFSSLDSFRLSGNSAEGFFHGGGLYSLSASVGDQAGRLEIRLGNNTIVSGNRSGGNGGGLYIGQDLSLSGNTLFENNRAAGIGGAVFMLGRTDQPQVALKLDATGGDIAFTGNEHGAGTNSIHFEEKTNVVISGTGNVFFDDPVSSGSDGACSLTKTGTGFVQFLGDNRFNSVSGTGGRVTVENGTFRLAGNGARFANGGGDARFVVSKTNDAVFGTLAGSGTVAAEGGISIRGTVSPDSDRFEIPLGIGTASVGPGRTAVATGREIGNLVLSSGMSVLLDGAVLRIDLGPDGVTSDRIDITGTAALGAVNTIDLTAFHAGTYTVLTALGGGLSADGFTVTLNGSSLKARQSVQRNSFGGTVLEITTATTNIDLTWNLTGGYWNETPTNGSWYDGIGSDAFMANDYVRFAGTGGTVTVQTTGVRTAGMIVTGGDYVFAGGRISGYLPTVPNGQTRTGKLEVTGGTVTLQNIVDFSNGMEIGSGATVVLADGAHFTGTMPVRNEGTLVFDRTGDYTPSGSFTGGGDFIKRGTGTMNLSDFDAVTGTLIQENGDVTITGSWGGDYVKQAGHLVLRGGATIGGNASLAGTVELWDAAGIGGDTDLAGTVQLRGAATIGGDLRFSGTLGINLGVDGTTSSRLDIGGDLLTSGVVIDIDIFHNGTYTILTAGDGIDAERFEVTVGGYAPGSRQGVTKTILDGTTLQLTTFSANTDLVWNGGDGRWDYGSDDPNWQSGDGADSFIANDYVRFGGGGTVAVRDAGVTTSGMSVSGGTYVFTGGKISAPLSTSNGQTITGKLEIEAADVILRNETDFADGVELADGTVVLGNDKSLGVYDDEGGGKHGRLAVSGTATIGTEGNRNIKNRFLVESGGRLRFDISPGSTLAVENVRASHDGAALFVESGSVAFHGGVSFCNNSTSGTGGAVHASNSSLSFDTSRGWIEFTGNADAGGANAIVLAGADNVLEISGSDHGVLFDDPIRAASGGNRLSVDFSGEDAFVQFQGVNTMNDGDGGRVDVTGGTMRLADGASFDAGQAALFHVTSGGILAGTGSFSSELFNVTGGRISPDRAVLTANSGGVSLADRIGTLALRGNLLLDGATLEVDLLPDGTSDRIDVTGSVAFGDNLNKVLIRTWSFGEYTILQADSIADIGGRFTLEFAGELLDDTKARLFLDSNSLKLKTSEATLTEIVEWVNGTGNGTWDTSGMDWGTGGTGTTNFLPGDYVVFAGDGEGVIRIIGDTALVGGMEVRDGFYDFRPEKRNATATIEGRVVEGSEHYPSSGALTQSGGTVIYGVRTDFVNGYRFRNRSKAVIANDKSFGTYLPVDVFNFTRFMDVLTAGEENVAGQLVFYENSDTVIGAETSHRITNRFVAKASSKLTFEIREDEQLVIENVRAGAVDGAVFSFNRAEGRFDGFMEIRGTSTTGRGGAFYLAESSFYFDTDKGGVAFYDNRESAGENTGVFAGNGNRLHFSGTSGGVVFGNGIRSVENSSGNRILLEFEGRAGFAEFRGVNTFDSTGSSDNGARIQGGSFRVTEGSSFDFGTGGFVEIGAGGNLAGGGTFIAPKIDFTGGALSPDNRAFTLGSQIIHDELQAAGLVLRGDTSFDGTTLVVELKPGGVSDTVYVEGGLDFGTKKNRVDVNAWNRGSFTVLETRDALPENADPFELTFGGEAVGTRQTARLERDGNRLRIHTGMDDADRLRLFWTGNSNMLLNAASSGNWVTEFGVGERFNNSDFLVFDETGRQGTITLGNPDGSEGGRTVSGMLLGGGSYRFTGGDLFGIKTKQNPSDGNLMISDGNVGFSNNVFFEGNIEILNRSTVTLAGKKAFHAAGDFVLADTAMLTLQPGDDLIRGRSVTLDGAVFLSGEPVPTSTRPYGFVNLISATQAALDTAALRTMFDHTVGLLERHVSFLDENRSMTLHYTATPLREYAALHGFTENETQWAGYFQDTFNNWEMADFERMLMELDDAELDALFDRLANSVLMAEAGRIALSDPYRIVTRHLIDDEKPVRDSRGRRDLFSTRNFRFSTMQRDLRQDGDGTAHGYSLSRTGMHLALDGYVTKSFRVGGLFVFAEPKLYGSGSRIEADDYTAGIYAQKRIGPWDMNGFFAYGDQSYRSRRQAFDAAARARFGGDARFASLELVRRMKLSDRFTLLPTLAVDYQDARIDGFEENGSLLKQRYEKGDLRRLVVRFGLNSGWRLNDRIRLDARLQYGRLVDGDCRTSIRSSMPTLSTAAPMTFQGVNVGRDLLNVGVGGQYVFGGRKQYRAFGHYDFDRGNRSKSHTGELGFAFAW